MKPCVGYGPFPLRRNRLLVFVKKVQFSKYRT